VGLRSGEWAINSQTRNTTPMEQNNLTFSPWKVERSSTGQLTITPTSVQTRLKGPKPLLLSYRQPNLPCCLLQHLNRSIKKHDRESSMFFYDPYTILLGAGILLGLATNFLFLREGLIQLESAANKKERKGGKERRGKSWEDEEELERRKTEKISLSFYFVISSETAYNIKRLHVNTKTQIEFNHISLSSNSLDYILHRSYYIYVCESYLDFFTIYIWFLYHVLFKSGRFRHKVKQK